MWVVTLFTLPALQIHYVLSIRNNINFGNLFVLQYGEGSQMSGNVTDHPVSHADRCVVVHVQ